MEKIEKSKKKKVETSGSKSETEKPGFELKDNQLETKEKNRKENVEVENTEKQIGETRKKLKEQYKKEEKPEISDKLSPRELIERMEEENRGEKETKLTEFLKGNSFSENFLDKRAEDIMTAIAGILQEIEDYLENLKERIYMADMGSGRGQITEAILNRFEDKMRGAICIDPHVDLSEEVKKRNKINNAKIIRTKEDARKTELENDSVEFATTFYLLQDLDIEDKLKVIKEMERIVKNEGYVLIVDELLREGSKNLEDAIKHYLLNLFDPGKYEIFQEEKWREKILDKISGEVVKFVEFGRNNFAALVKVRKEQ